MMEFHIGRDARERYQFAETLFSYTGNVVLADMPACRELTHRMNQVRETDTHPEQALHAGELYAIGLIDEASHVLMARYRQQFDPEVMNAALDWFAGQVGEEKLKRLLLKFVEHFPGSTVIRGDHTPDQWLGGSSGGYPNRAAALEELMLLWSANRNEAFNPFAELFNEKELVEKTSYPQVTARLGEFFATRPLIPTGEGKGMNLLEMLREPALRAPGSLIAQLAIIRKLWGPLLGDALERLLLMAGEILREEELTLWAQFHPRGGGARGPQGGITSESEVPEYSSLAHEYERFSQDMHWMPSAVLIAKSTYVWLAQLSRQYGRHIGRLDEIPDEELALLAQRGMNSLWLIGVWERSRASKTIKQLCGNRDAVASAYSLYDYRIAEDLGGEAAYTNLRDHAYRHGIRLASDMVPNHMGIDSPWVIEHPEWFISRWEPPYPSYSFNGPNLSNDDRVEIKIEDHYFEQSDAAVVFRRRDTWTGETRYVYHGNDGTSFPWNDTAQLDYLNPAVREQVIQTILHVARLFPVIRFDAAMTLAKRHFHRLWFPGPGSSGAIPSRAEYGMTQGEFDQAMPQEFWREVVDRVAAEVPGTLLLAEAFWLMEGYFVRTLGMHRVYNSAFMNMMRDEENAKYRSVIKNTLEFDPDIMKRYVNFMSNPDERTAVDQFGTGDKCFGVTVLMSTLPGLPMFGHGQIEGFTEKYGMEYRWPRYEENPDRWLVARHDREVAPLLKKRWLFAESTEFLLYDFFEGSGSVDENVFAYSNRSGGERALVVYNNRFRDTHGTVDISAAYADKDAGQLRQRRLREGLGLSGDHGVVLAWRDLLTGLEYLRRAGEVLDRGLTLGLHAYQCHVFLDWRELRPSAEEPWDRLCDFLGGRGVPNLGEALVSLELQPVHEALRELLEPPLVRQVADHADEARVLTLSRPTAMESDRKEAVERVWVQCERFVQAARNGYMARLTREGGETVAEEPAPMNSVAAAMRQRMRAAMRFPAVEAQFTAPWCGAARRVLPCASPQFTATAMWGPVLAWSALDALAEYVAGSETERAAKIAVDLFDRLRLREPLARAFEALGLEGEEAWRGAARVKALMLRAALDADATMKAENESAETPARVRQTKKKSKPATNAATEQAEAGAGKDDLLPRALWRDPDVQWLTGVHEAEGHYYVVQEPYEELLWWMQMPALLRLGSQPSVSREATETIGKAIVDELAAVKEAGYTVDEMLREDDASDTDSQQAEDLQQTEGTEAREEESGDFSPGRRK
jgi:glycosidase